MAATRGRFVDSTAAPAAWPASTAPKDVPMKRRRERRSSPGLRGQSANDGFMRNLEGAMGAGIVAWSAPLGFYHLRAAVMVRRVELPHHRQRARFLPEHACATA